MEGSKDAREGDLRFQSNIQSCRVCNVCEGAVKHWLCRSLLDFHPSIEDHTQTTKFGCTNTNSEIEAPISTWRLSVNDFKKMNSNPYIRLTLSNLAALSARANLLVLIKKNDHVLLTPTIKTLKSPRIYYIEKSQLLLHLECPGGHQRTPPPLRPRSSTPAATCATRAGAWWSIGQYCPIAQDDDCNLSDPAWRAADL
jgi:hypothetical protein